MRRMVVGCLTAVLALSVAACESEAPPDDQPPAEEGSGQDVGDGGESDAGAAASDDGATLGVVDEPCPGTDDEDALDGCLHLGTLVQADEHDSAHAEDLLAGRRGFWDHVNAEGGVGGYAVHVADHEREVSADPREQVEAYDEIADDVLALALLPGEATSGRLLEAMERDDMVGVLPAWWSGWHRQGTGETALVPGYSHCLGAALSLDWYAEEIERPTSVLAVGHPNIYGEDVAAGAAAWTDATEAEWLGFAETGTREDAGEQDAAVQQIVYTSAEVVVLGVGAAEAGEIVRKAGEQGYEGTFLGATPTWDARLMDQPGAARTLQALYRHVAPWEGLDGRSPAHEAMREALSEEGPLTHGYVAGWVESYPLLAALEQATRDGPPTRADVREAIDGLAVDYAGALPSVTLEAGRAPFTGVATMSRPHPEGDLGLAHRADLEGGEVTDGLAHPDDCHPPAAEVRSVP
jgi:ABC-type branched-subunit amino acid transport system substrate-binding protein